MKRNPRIARAIEEKFPNWVQKQEAQLGLDNFHKFRDEISLIYSAFNYTPQHEIDNSTLNNLFDIQPDSETFIRWLGCARAWPDSIECSLLNRIESIQDRRCTTLMHKGTMQYDMENRNHLFNSTIGDILSAPYYTYFDAKEITKMVIDFKPEDYGDLKRQVGARIVFHGNNFVASFNELDFFVTRGYRYDFNIDREVTILLDKPYIGCWNYEDNNLYKFKNIIDPRIPLHVNTCFQNCVIINIINRFNCWPPLVPYFKNDTLDPNKNYKACIWFKDTLYSTLYKEMLRVLKLKNKKLQQKKSNQSSLSSEKIISKDDYDENDEKSKAQMRTYKRVRRHCWRKCMIGCNLIRYSVTVTRSVWPTDIRISLDKTGKDRLLRHCCALMTIKYSHFHHTVQELVPKYNLIDTIGNVGGLLAVWLGFSMVSVYHASQKLIELFNKRSSMCKVENNNTHTNRNTSMLHNNKLR